AVVLDNHSEHRRSYLRMSRLVGLNAAEHLFEHVIANHVRQRREPYELEVGEPSLKDEIGRHRKLYGISSQQQLVNQMPCRHRHPVIGVIKFVDPVKLRIPLDDWVHEEERNLGMRAFVERTKHGRVAPGAVSPKSGCPEITYHRSKFGQWKRRTMKLESADPRGVEFFEVLNATDRIVHRAHRDFLLM